MCTNAVEDYCVYYENDAFVCAYDRRDARQRACTRCVWCQKTERHVPAILPRRSWPPPRRHRCGLLRRRRPRPMAVAPRPCPSPRHGGAVADRVRAPVARTPFVAVAAAAPLYFFFFVPVIFSRFSRREYKIHVLLFCRVLFFLFCTPSPLLFSLGRATRIDECCYANIDTDMRARVSVDI